MYNKIWKKKMHSRNELKKFTCKPRKVGPMKNMHRPPNPMHELKKYGRKKCIHEGRPHEEYA
jgi:hypothetical protein